MKINLVNFIIRDVEEPELYIAQPLHRWWQTEFGQWVSKHIADIIYVYESTPDMHGNQVALWADIDGPILTEFYLKWKK
jgi:hypothetical protein